jgi:hypothetical protein
MHGGEISDNWSNVSTTGSNSGQGTGGVRVSGGALFTMYDGKISGNGARFTTPGGGGVRILGANSRMVMHGGEITGNIAASPTNMTVGEGGGILVSGGSVTLLGGTISGNQSMQVGAGVHVSAGAEITLGGTIQIYDNTPYSNAQNRRSNLRFDSNTFINLADGSNGPPPSDGMRVELNKAQDIIFVKSGAIADYTEYFFVDNINAEIFYRNGHLKTGPFIDCNVNYCDGVIIFECDNPNCGVIPDSCEEDGCDGKIIGDKCNDDECIYNNTVHPQRPGSSHYFLSEMKHLIFLTKA